jgi:hypothetical protein
MTDPPYSEPRIVTSLGDCYFYHTMDVPGHGLVTGEWDLRPGLDAYLGHFNFAGKRVLDIGAASGILSFHVERQGAEVVSYDLSDAYPWDIVPHAGADFDTVDAARREHIRRINNGYWLCHRAFKSRARVVYGVAYDIPVSIGSVDVAIYGSVLLHLRDPFLALQNGARLARQAIIVADVPPPKRWRASWREPCFVPASRNLDNTDTWWNLPPRLVCEFLAVLGFERSVVTWHRQLYFGRKYLLYTVISYR